MIANRSNTRFVLHSLRIPSAANAPHASAGPINQTPTKATPHHEVPPSAGSKYDGGRRKRDCQLVPEAAYELVQVIKKPNKMERTTLDVLFNSDPTVNSHCQPSQKKARRTRAPSFAANRIIAPGCACSHAPSVPRNRSIPVARISDASPPNARIHKFPTNNNTVYLVLMKYRLSAT